MQLAQDVLPIHFSVGNTYDFGIFQADAVRSKIGESTPPVLHQKKNLPNPLKNK